MTPEQKSKYEEAAKAHFDAIGRPDDGNEMRAWIAGAEHASKEAHNEAIDKAIERLTIMDESGYPYRWEGVKSELEKLKL